MLYGKVFANGARKRVAILPIDILDAKRLPIIGWLDEVTSLAILVQKMSKYITPEMEMKKVTKIIAEAK